VRSFRTPNCVVRPASPILATPIRKARPHATPPRAPCRQPLSLRIGVIYDVHLRQSEKPARIAITANIEELLNQTFILCGSASNRDSRAATCSRARPHHLSATHLRLLPGSFQSPSVILKNLAQQNTARSARRQRFQ
jgi:hypothetical protein